MVDAVAAVDTPQGNIQDFIFLRELSEVYLLLDHICGRWDKDFLPLNGQPGVPNPDSIDQWIEEICKVAYWFKWKISAIVLFLCMALIVTCLLSWDMTSGHTPLTRLDALHAETLDIRQRVAALAPKVNAPCLQPPDATGESGDAFLCNELRRVAEADLVARQGLSDWLYGWRWSNAAYVHRYPYWKYGGAQAGHIEVVDQATRSPQQPDQSAADEAWARTFVPLLLNCVLPFCYGFLGAGAAVVRYLRFKTKESLLSPRDFTLAMSQLVLGATVGACIGLFVGQPGPLDGASKGLMVPSGLTASALAFVAGFGVEGVFLALESLVRRIFNMPDVAQKS